MNLRELKTLGFDHSYRNGNAYRVQCSCCDALVINGYPTHERGCSNAVHECNGCNALISTNQRYCEDCAL